MNGVSKTSLLTCAAFLATISFALAVEATEPASSGGVPMMRRLTADQYRRTLLGIFGNDIDLDGKFEPEVRENGLIALGAGRVSVTTTGLQRFDATARSVAAQVVNPAHRATLVGCKPANERTADEACATKFIARVGPLLYRRVLTADEAATYVKIAGDNAQTLKSFYDGLALSLAAMMSSPNFLFHRDAVEPDPQIPGHVRLTADAIAARLSFYLWNAGPDRALIEAAADGSLQTPKGLATQVDRMLASPRLEHGVRAFFTDMLQLDAFETLTKDAIIYPKFSQDVSRDAREQLLRTVVNHLIARDADYRDLFTTRDTFITPVLGTLYRVPVAPPSEIDFAGEGWQPFTFPPNDPRAGILSQPAFVALHSHPGRSSPTLRGKALREMLFCQKVPDPPANVDFSLLQQTGHELFKTTRERVNAHLTNPMCAGCHKLVDPIGLALENFDSAGAYRTTENGVKIDASGELNGRAFNDAVGLGQAVHDSPQTTRCLVSRVYAYGTGRPVARGESEFVKYIEDAFAKNGYRLKPLLREITTSQGFYRVVKAEDVK